LAKFLFQKGNKYRQGIKPWNKGTKGICKANSGTFKVGEKHHNKPHSEETKSKISKNFKKRWSEGCYDNRPSHSEETREKIRQTLRSGKFIKCIICGKDTYVAKSVSNRKYCSNKCFYIGFSGKNNPNWTGAKYKPYKHYRNARYINWRKQVFERDTYTCQKCFIKGGYLHPHHLKSYTFFPEFRYEVDNGKTLCVECHKLVHGKVKFNRG
jgi:NUMOD3 motif.